MLIARDKVREDDEVRQREFEEERKFEYQRRDGTGSPSYLTKNRESNQVRKFKDNMRESYKLLPKKTLNLLYGDLDFGEPVVGGNVKF